MTSNVYDLVKVKPLQWEKSRFNSWNGDYHTIPTAYAVRCADENGWKWAGYGCVGYSSSPETAKAAAQADYESRILAALTPAEPCFSVKGGYEVKAEKKFFARPYRNCHLAEALTIRSAEEVRREALEEAEDWLWDYMGTKMPGLYVRGSMIKALLGTPAPPTDKTQPFQDRVKPWMDACFGPEISGDRLERGDRLLEEVFELLQSGDYPVERVVALRDYVWNRDKGEPHQEVGGVMVTLAAYCLAHDLDMHEAGENELARVWTKVEKIRAKQAAKPVGSALPVAYTDTSPSVAEAAKVLLISLGDVDNNRSHPVFEVAAKAFSESNKPSPFNEIGDAVVAALRALAAQTGGE